MLSFVKLALLAAVFTSATLVDAGTSARRCPPRSKSSTASPIGTAVYGVPSPSPAASSSAAPVSPIGTAVYGVPSPSSASSSAAPVSPIGTAVYGAPSPSPAPASPTNVYGFQNSVTPGGNPGPGGYGGSDVKPTSVLPTTTDITTTAPITLLPTTTAASTTAAAPTTTAVAPVPPFLPEAGALPSGSVLYSAIAVLASTNGSSVTGTVRLDQYESGAVIVDVDAKGFAPNSVHAIHVHAFGDLTNERGLNAFGHYNPLGKPHSCVGFKDVKPADTHAGDLGNAVADASGAIKFVYTQVGVNLDLESPAAAIGRGVVIHAKPDDCTTQPTGAAGDRIAVGVFGWKNGTTKQPSTPAAGVTFDPKYDDPTTPRAAVAVLSPTTAGPKVSGTVYFRQKDAQSPVEISLKLSGVEPGSEHGVHLHALGDLTDPAGMAVAGHFNPFNKPHACGDSEERHAGDLGNVKADDHGKVAAVFSNALLSLYKGSKGFLPGRAFVLHGGKDDCSTQPTGNSGARLAVGVIGYRNGTLVDA
ncbi:hypothetical protein HDU96_003167 [Phlyctochytrium bullatum]|nr:hypothetical protein HDU96_003167 [Phlyctochytrium bullatum]